MRAGDVVTVHFEPARAPPGPASSAAAVEHTHQPMTASTSPPAPVISVGSTTIVMPTSGQA